MTREEATRQHQFEQAKAQSEIAKELKELNANVKSLIKIIDKRLTLNARKKRSRTRGLCP